MPVSSVCNHAYIQFFKGGPCSISSPCGESPTEAEDVVNRRGEKTNYDAIRLLSLTFPDTIITPFLQKNPPSCPEDLFFNSEPTETHSMPSRHGQRYRPGRHAAFSAKYAPPHRPVRASARPGRRCPARPPCTPARCHSARPQ